MSQITLKMCFTEDCTCLTGQHAGPALIPGTRLELKISVFKSAQYHIFLHNHDLCFFFIFFFANLFSVLKGLCIGTGGPGSERQDEEEEGGEEKQ